MAEPRSDSSFYPKNHFLKVSGGYLNFKLISSAKEVWLSDASQVFENPIKLKYFYGDPTSKLGQNHDYCPKIEP